MVGLSAVFSSLDRSYFLPRTKRTLGDQGQIESRTRERLTDLLRDKIEQWGRRLEQCPTYFYRVAGTEMI